MRLYSFNPPTSFGTGIHATECPTRFGTHYRPAQTPAWCREKPECSRLRRGRFLRLEGSENPKYPSLSLAPIRVRGLISRCSTGPRYRAGHASLGAGIALTWGQHERVVVRDRYETSADPSTAIVIGVPIRGQGYLTPPLGYGWIGLKLSSFANVNGERSFVGFTVGVLLGDLR